MFWVFEAPTKRSMADGRAGKEPSRRRRPALAGAAILILILVPGCTSSSSNGGDGSASCARRIAIADRTFTDASGTDVTAGEKIASVTFLPCADTGGDDGTPDAEDHLEKTNAYEIKGLDSKLAVAVGDTATATELFVHEEEDGKVPAEVQKFIDAAK